jgi:hypothetical protein
MTRSPGQNSRMPGAGSGACGPWPLVLVSAVLLLGLAHGGAGLPEPVPERGSPCSAAGSLQGIGAEGEAGHRLLSRGPAQQSCVRFQGTGFDTWAAFGGAPSLFPAHARWCAARGRFPVDSFTVQRWGRARQAIADTAIARRVRYPVSSGSTRSGLADQPSIVTCPLRGPPASR